MNDIIILFNAVSIISLAGIIALTVYSYFTFWRKGAKGVAAAA